MAPHYFVIIFMSNGPDTLKGAPNFKGATIEIPNYPQTYTDSGSPTGRAVDHVRNLLEKFIEEVDYNNPLAGEILSVNPQSGESSLNPLSEAKIYLVDDQPEVSRSMKRVIGRHFQDIEVFDDGQDVLDAIYSEGKLVKVPHMVISDTNMKRVHGPQLAKALQQIDPEIRPRFTAITGIFQDGNINDYVDMGLSVLEKPISPVGNLLATMTMELRRHPGFRPVQNK